MPRAKLAEPSDRQFQVARTVLEYIELHGWAPTMTELQEELGVGRGPAQRLVARCVEHGLLRRAPGEVRGLSRGPRFDHWRRRRLLAEYRERRAQG